MLIDAYGADGIMTDPEQKRLAVEHLRQSHETKERVDAMSSEELQEAAVEASNLIRGKNRKKRLGDDVVEAEVTIISTEMPESTGEWITWTRVNFPKAFKTVAEANQALDEVIKNNPKISDQWQAWNHVISRNLDLQAIQEEE